MNLDEPRHSADYQLDVAAQLAGLSVTRVRRCMRAGLVQPARVDGGLPRFGELELARLRKIRRLVDDLGLNLAGADVVLRLLDEIHQLRDEHKVNWQRLPDTRM